MRILLSGMIAGDPHQGGATWAVLQYVLGLRRLGHAVDVVEPVANRESFESPLVRGYWQCVAKQFALTGGLLHPESNATFGFDRFGEYDLLLNISGMLKHDIIQAIPVRLFLDLDPAFIQCWHAQGIDMNLAAHTHFATVGAAIGTADCPVPTCGLNWLATRPPVVLEHWPRCDDAPAHGFTTIANWRGYGSVTNAGVVYGQKAHSLRRFIDLPSKSRHRIEPALAIHAGETADIAALHRHGWTWHDPAAVAGTPDDYRRFVQQSRGEFGLAKAGYADSRCGWFSDRSAAYLASGRPVLAQDTGATGIPTGEGLLTFDSVETIVAGLDEIASNEEKHRAAARAIAEAYFDSDSVLKRLLEKVGGPLVGQASEPVPQAPGKTGGQAQRPVPPEGDGPPTNQGIAALLNSQGVIRRPSGYRTSYPIDEVDVRIADGTTLHLLLKDLRRDALTDAATAAKPAFLHNPQREIDAYTTLLGGVHGPPRCFASSRNPPWLLLERVPGRELYQCGDIADWARAAAWLAQFHQTQVAKADAWQDHPALSIQWLQRAIQYHSTPLLECVLHHWPRLLALVGTQPVTVLHGEFYASNILLDGDRVAPVDWEMTGRGPGVLDLAALVAGDWDAADRAAIVSAYNSRPDAAFEDALAAARLLVAVQWLGWSDDWTPPAATAHDWLADVAAQCERLGLA